LYNARYIDNLQSKPTDDYLKVIGFLIDLCQGSIQLVSDDVIHPIAFGMGASAFTAEEQERQRYLITKQQMMPLFSLMNSGTGILEETAIMKVNFGQSPFHFQMNATPLQQINQHVSTKGGNTFYLNLYLGIDSITILDAVSSSRDKIGQEEDEKINAVLFKSYLIIILIVIRKKLF
jgi:hypothetical protein